jgi:hypothetical protein
VKRGLGALNVVTGSADFVGSSVADPLDLWAEDQRDSVGTYHQVQLALPDSYP